MADESQGPDWWIAAHGRWYPPELHPDPTYWTARKAPPDPPPPVEPRPTLAHPVHVPGGRPAVVTPGRAPVRRIGLGAAGVAVIVVIVVVATTVGHGSGAPSPRPSASTTASHRPSASRRSAASTPSTMLPAPDDTRTAPGVTLEPLYPLPSAVPDPDGPPLVWDPTVPGVRSNVPPGGVTVTARRANNLWVDDTENAFDGTDLRIDSELTMSPAARTDRIGLGCLVEEPPTDPSLPQSPTLEISATIAADHTWVVSENQADEPFTQQVLAEGTSVLIRTVSPPTHLTLACSTVTGATPTTVDVVVGVDGSPVVNMTDVMDVSEFQPAVNLCPCSATETGTFADVTTSGF